MNWRAAVLGVLILVAGAGAAWFGITRYGSRASAPAAVSADVPGASDSEGGDDTVSVDGESDATPTDVGTTPMAQRVAVLGLLNKRNGVSRDVTMKPGQAIRVGDVVIRLRACERTAPWEPEQLTGAFVQLDVQGIDKGWRRVFSGWLYKERPAANAVLHPIYDVWAKSCAVKLPDDSPAPSPTSTSKAPKSAPAAQSAGDSGEEDATARTGASADNSAER